MLALLLASLPVALAATQTVKVGDGGALKFTPHTITGQVGDTIEFQWSSAGHSVTQSTFDKPCAPVNGGIFSGFLSTPKVFTVTLNNTDPIWVYCAAQGHCQAGMSMVINAPSSGQNIAGYQSAASNAGSSNAPSAVSGGIVANAGASLFSSGTASSASATSTGSSSGGGGAYGGGSGGSSSAASKGMITSTMGVFSMIVGLTAWLM